MIKELMHDPLFLAGKSEIATKEDLQVIKAGTLPSIVAMETAAQILYELIVKEMNI